MLFVFGLSSCTTVSVPNERVCVDKSVGGATCGYTNTNDVERYSKAEWDEMRIGWACMEVPALTRLIGVIKKLCFDTNKCSYDEKKQVKAALDHINVMYENLTSQSLEQALEIQSDNQK